MREFRSSREEGRKRRRKQKGKIELKETRLVRGVVSGRYEWNEGMIRMEIVEL